MSIFSRKKEDIDQEEEELEELEVKDLRPQHQRKRKALPKPWGRRERYTVLIFLLATVLISAILAASSRNWKLPGFSRLSLPKFPKITFDFLSGETITIGKKNDQVNEEKKERILKAFREKTKNLSGTYALFLVDLESGYAFGENEDQVLTAASLIKLPVIAGIYLEAERGKINLEDKPTGANLTYRQLAEEMGKRSNNAAQVTAVNALGRDKIQRTIDSIGMKDTSYSKNETTAHDIGVFFQNLWNDKVVPRQARDEILGYLTDTIFEDWIKAGLPVGTRLAHKYGRETHVISDAGIVFAKKPFVLVVMSQGVVDGEADKIIPEIAAFVFAEYK